MKLTVIKTNSTNPYDNLAAEEYLTFHAEEDEMIPCQPIIQEHIMDAYVFPQ